MKTLNEKFMVEISKIKQPEIFLGVVRILKVKLMEDEKTPRDFVDVFRDCVEAYHNMGRERKKELLKILKQANKAKIEEGEADGDRTENSQA